MDDDCTKAMRGFYFFNFRIHLTVQLYTRFACTMRTLRSPHNVELKTPEAKFCLDFDLACVSVCVYPVHVLCTNKCVRLCARKARFDVAGKS